MAEILGTALRTASRLAKRLVLTLGNGAGYSVATLSADGTVGEYSPPVLFVAPDAARNLDFLAEVEVAGSCFIVGNTDPTNTVTVRDSAAATVLALKPKEFGLFVYSGTAWKFMQAQVGTLTASLLASANTWAALQTFGAGIAAKGPVTFKDAADATKVASWVLSGITTGTTRSYTLPDATGVIALLGLAQTWSAQQTFSGGVVGDLTGNASGTAGSLASGATFLSTQQTGTGSAQNIAHGFGQIPRIAYAIPDDIGGGGVFSVSYGSHDSTNVVVTFSNGQKYRVVAFK